MQQRKSDPLTTQQPFDLAPNLTAINGWQVWPLGYPKRACHEGMESRPAKIPRQVAGFQD
jgi:hypothetical protein